MAQQVEQVLNSKPSFITTKHPSVDEQEWNPYRWNPYSLTRTASWLLELERNIERVILTLEKWLDAYDENELEG